MEDNFGIEEVLGKKYRHFMILLYEDSKSYNFKDVLRLIKSNKHYAYIKHFAESSETKEHFHIILSLENTTKVETLSKKLGIGENYIRVIKNLRSACRYLIHKDDEDKYQYDINQVIVSPLFERKFNMQFDDIKDEPIIINEIYQFIENSSNLGYFDALKGLIQFVNYNCYDTIYKRYRNEFLDYLKNSCNY